MGAPAAGAAAAADAAVDVDEVLELEVLELLQPATAAVTTAAKPRHATVRRMIR
jgi:hypothetical protein